MKRWMRWMAALVLTLTLCPGGRADSVPARASVDITSSCEFRVSEGSRGKLTDGSVTSTWTYENENAFVGLHIPDNIDPGWLRVEWMFDPEGFELEEYDRDLNVIRVQDQDDTFPNIYTVLPLLPETRFVRLLMTAAGQEIGRMYVYSAGELPPEVQKWNPPVEKADLMVVSTHQDDELIFLGGTIPYYAVALDRPTVVVYMANCTRSRRREALDALWEMGVRDYPEFINLRDKRVDSIEEGIALWGGQDAILSELAARIRRFRPEVIVTQDLNGEYGHNQHRITARAMMYAIDASADPARYPESAEIYGAWQVKKLYHHLYAENELTMDWLTPLEALGGLSPLQVAQNGMQKHASQLDYYQVVEGGKYDNAKFGLYFTTVGEDVAKDDFLEHIETAPAATATPEPTPETTPAPTPEPVQTEAPTPLPEPEDTEIGPAQGREMERRASAWPVIGIAAVLAGAAGAGVYALNRRANRRRHHRRRR